MSFAVFASGAGFEVVFVPDWEQAFRYLKRHKASACLTPKPQDVLIEEIKKNFSKIKWIVFDTPLLDQDIKYLNALGADAVFFQGHATPGAILKVLLRSSQNSISAARLLFRLQNRKSSSVYTPYKHRRFSDFSP